MQKLSAECIGSFFLVLALGLTGNALASGLFIIAIIYLGGQISGAHYNPAVSLAFWAAGRMSGREFFAYLASQITGALAGAVFIFLISGSVFQTSPSAAASPFEYASVELLFGFLFCMTYLILFLTGEFRNNVIYGLVIGLSYSGMLMLGEPISGGVLNPAVSATTSVVDLFNNGTSYLYLPAYILAPALGGILAGNLFRYFFRNDLRPPSEE